MKKLICFVVGHDHLWQPTVKTTVINKQGIYVTYGCYCNRCGRTVGVKP